MKKITHLLLIFLFLAPSALLNAQEKSDSLKPQRVLKQLKLINGRADIRDFKLLHTPTNLQELQLSVRLNNYVHTKEYTQKTIRIEIERLNQGKIERIEIARLFIPWIKPKADIEPDFTFDISAYSALFLKSVNLVIESSTGPQPLDVDLQFDWKIGSAPATPMQVINLWHSDIKGFSYQDKKNPINKRIPNRTIKVSKDIKYALIKIYLSGSGNQLETTSEADCSKFYFLNINSQTVAKRPVWRDDCGLNALFPQEGPWNYSRANWCPGQALRVYDHFIALGTDTTLNIGLQLQEAAKENPLLLNYVLSANLILYSQANSSNDAAIIEILAPNKSKLHKRYNPICSSPVIRVKNTGSDTLRTVLIEYGIDQKKENRYRWRGELAFMEEEIVYLPPLNWYFYNHQNKPTEFFVAVTEVNKKADEYNVNNQLTSELNSAPVFPSNISIQFHTNCKASENILELVDDMGIPLFEANSLENDSTYTFDLKLEAGCYEFIVYDQEGNGITNPKNYTIKGSLKLIDTKTKKELVNFEPNFGAEIRQQFMILK
ncbi:MAG: hypothetical protein JW729_00695 [Bacteroidales bacterium]|nr:hypothetical protein [Bacteroidales bacterium]